MNESDYANYSNITPQYSDSNNAPKRNRRLLIIGIAAAVGLIIILSIVAYVLFGNSSSTNESNKKEAVISTDELQQSLSEVDVATDNAKASTADLKDTLNSYDPGKKVSE